MSEAEYIRLKALTELRIAVTLLADATVLTDELHISTTVRADVLRIVHDWIDQLSKPKFIKR